MTKEDSLQIAVIDYLRYQFPHVLAFHCPNGGSRNAIEGAKLKRMGVLAGVSDILIFHRCRMCAIELKIKPNLPTPKQKEFGDKWVKEGGKFFVAFDILQAKKIIDEFLNNYILL